MKTIYGILKSNEYPGRGIAVGLSPSGRYAVAAYFIMGRSANSRNRVFATDGEGIRTQAFDPSKMTDSSLVIYAPVRTAKDALIVTNGDQTDTIKSYLQTGKSFKDALLTRTYEPDAPHFTPRINALLHLSEPYSYEIAILKASAPDGGDCAREFFSYPAQNGVGHLIHTYKENGNPLPSFKGAPIAFQTEEEIDAFTNSLWNALNEDNKISLFVRYIDLKTRNAQTRIVNKNKDKEPK